MKFIRAFCLVLAVFLAGCSSTGVDVKTEDIDRLKPGVTTEQEVVQRFGPPTSTTMLPNGVKVLYYTHKETSIKAYQVLPIAFVLTGGPDTTITAVELDFDGQQRYIGHRLIKGKEAEKLFKEEESRAKAAKDATAAK